MFGTEEEEWIFVGRVNFRRTFFEVVWPERYALDHGLDSVDKDELILSDIFIPPQVIGPDTPKTYGRIEWVR
jgi:hypothetical protein